jgi:hypothetical protein
MKWYSPEVRAAVKAVDKPALNFKVVIIEFETFLTLAVDKKVSQVETQIEKMLVDAYLARLHQAISKFDIPVRVYGYMRAYGDVEAMIDEFEQEMGYG